VGTAVQRLEGVNGWTVALLVIAILMLVDLALLVEANRRFRRSRLITRL
jgi:hypothetical protein